MAIVLDRPGAELGRIGEGKRFFIRTMGCQMNEHDTEIMRGILTELGYGEAPTLEEADLVLFNTCSVRENPERRVYGQVMALKGLKEERPGMLIGIAGCMPQSRQERARIVEQLPHVDIVFGTKNIHRLPLLIQQAMDTGRQVVEVWDEDGDIVEGLPVQREDDLKAFVTIIYGCDYRCTFCIVPQTRGRQRSRRPEAIVAEVERLAAEGYKEVTLLGQTVDAYGKDLGDGTTLASLLRRLNEIDGIERLRFTTSHPRDITPELIDAMAECDKVCEHLHLPVQSGSDRILKLMARRYNRQQYVDLVNRLRDRIPDLALTTDIIVGFPGETEEDFQQTLSLVEEVRFDSSFTFIYSPRPGTGAPNLPDPTTEEEKRERLHRLNEVQARITREASLALKDKVVEVLVEGASQHDPRLLSGRTRTNKIVSFAGPAELRGQLVSVRITRPRTWTLVGELVDAPALAR